MYYAIKRTNITTSSVLIDFGAINVSIITVYANSGNSSDVYIDWNGGMAVVPAANVAGNYCLASGQTITLDIRGMKRNKISIIAESGTQTVSILAIQ
ncbi:MAG TPA: hypothetical protein ENH82_17990 [bacterium]|nr:hypothetical protein [bacterium]